MSVCSFTPFSDSDAETVRSVADPDETRKQIAVLLEEIVVLNKVSKEKTGRVGRLLQGLGNDLEKPILRHSMFDTVAKIKASQNLGDKSPSAIQASE